MSPCGGGGGGWGVVGGLGRVRQGRTGSASTRSGSPAGHIPHTHTHYTPHAPGPCAGRLAPAATPKPVLERLHEAIVRVGEMPDVKARIAALAIDPVTSTAQDFAQRIASEVGFWSQVARAKNIYAD